MGNSGRGRERELGLVYTIQMAPADNGALRRGITSGERKGRHCWRFHCHAWQSVRRRNLQINYILRLTRKLRLVRLYGRRIFEGARGVEVPASQDYHCPD